jgi:hypothetical protein
MEYDFHPAADLFPMMTDAEIDALGEDMLAHGQSEPIILFLGQILDGRNRYRACLAKGIEPRFRQERPADPCAFVATANLHRRHLDPSQRAIIAAKLADMRQGSRTDLQPQGRKSQAAAAQLLDVGQRSVGRARAVIDHGADMLVAAVEAGKVPVSAAAKFVHDHPPSVQNKLIMKAGGSVAAAVEKANAAPRRGLPPPHLDQLHKMLGVFVRLEKLGNAAQVAEAVKRTAVADDTLARLRRVAAFATSVANIVGGKPEPAEASS